MEIVVDVFLGELKGHKQHKLTNILLCKFVGFLALLSHMDVLMCFMLNNNDVGYQIQKEFCYYLEG